MPQFPSPNPELTREQALNMILSSIAMEELALSHILNAQGEKLSHVLNGSSCPGRSACPEDILAMNKSVTTLLEMVMQNQLILKIKMDRALEYLPRPEPIPSRPPCLLRPVPRLVLRHPTAHRYVVLPAAPPSATSVIALFAARQLRDGIAAIVHLYGVPMQIVSAMASRWTALTVLKYNFPVLAALRWIFIWSLALLI